MKNHKVLQNAKVNFNIRKDCKVYICSTTILSGVVDSHIIIDFKIKMNRNNFQSLLDWNSVKCPISFLSALEECDKIDFNQSVKNQYKAGQGRYHLELGHFCLEQSYNASGKGIRYQLIADYFKFA